MSTISIAMATYNGERYLREQLDSILTQTIPFHELIICDDVSTDRTWEILLEYAEKDSRIKPYRNEQNLGFLKNFEKALTLCTGDFIALSDQDDIWLPEHLEVLLNGIGEKMLAVGDAEIIDASGYRSGHLLSKSLNLGVVPDDDLKKAYYIFYYRSPYHGMAMLMRREFLAKMLPIPQEIIYHDIWIGSLACFYGGLNYLSVPVTLYRRHAASISGSKIHTTRIRNLIGRVLLDKALSNRPTLVDSIRERMNGLLSEEQTRFLDASEKYYKRRKSIFGRIINFFFDITHFKLIYGCK